MHIRYIKKKIKLLKKYFVVFSKTKKKYSTDREKMQNTDEYFSCNYTIIISKKFY